MGTTHVLTVELIFQFFKLISRKARGVARILHATHSRYARAHVLVDVNLQALVCIGLACARQ